MGGSRTDEFETTDWVNDQSLLASANVLSPTGSSADDGDGLLWSVSDGFENVALAAWDGQRAHGSEDSASGTALARLADGGDWRSDAGERSGVVEPEGGFLRSAGPSGANAGAGSATASAVTIANGATVDIDGPSVQSVTFTGTTGTLKLEDPQGFTGLISGLSGADAIDLSGFAYGANVTATLPWQRHRRHADRDRRDQDGAHRALRQLPVVDLDAVQRRARAARSSSIRRVDQLAGPQGRRRRLRQRLGYCSRRHDGRAHRHQWRLFVERDRSGCSSSPHRACPPRSISTAGKASTKSRLPPAIQTSCT